MVQKTIMIRKSFLLPKPVIAWYQQEAFRKGVSLSDIIRITLLKNMATNKISEIFNANKKISKIFNTSKGG